MILLEAGNKVLADTVADKLRAPAAEAKREPIDVRLCDFDDVTYRVVIEKNTPDVMEISMNLPCWGQIKDFGGEEALKTHYEGLIASESAPGYDVTLKIDFTQPIANPDELVQKISLLKTNLVGGVFHRHFNALLNGTAPAEPYKFSLHTDTSIYIFPSADRVTVVFTLDFTERVDVAVAKVFLQEFAESRRHLGSAPPCSFNVNPPMEMKHFNITEPQGKLGFISFAILKNHVDNNKLARVVGTLQNFRNYLQYHIKCSKSHFHARMRARVKALLKVLNRAKTDQDENAPKKTITGKTFVRK